MLSWNSEVFAALRPLIVTVLLPLLALAFYLLLGKRPPDDVMGGRRADSRLIGRVLIGFWFWMIGPIERFFVRHRLSPNWLTMASAAVSLWAGYLLFRGDFGWGGWLIIAGGTLDILDGKVARAMDVSSDAGAFFDSALDRYADIFVLAGLVAFYRESWLMVLPLLALNGTVVTSYVRARGQALGVNCGAGLMQRAERLLLIGVSCVLAPIVAALTEGTQPVFWLTAGALGILAVLSNYTAAFRIHSVYAALAASHSAPKPAPAATEPLPLRRAKAR